MAAAMLLIFCLCMVLASLADLAKMIIPNELVVAVAAAFLVFAQWGGWPLERIALHLGVGVLALALTFGAFSLGWMGGGDAKLIAATALWFGPDVALWDYIFLSSLFGGVLTLTVILMRSCMKPVTGYASLDRLLHPASGVPYGVALGPAGLLVMLQSAEIQPLVALVGRLG